MVNPQESRLYLYNDPATIKSQLQGSYSVKLDTEQLVNDISTDAIIPSWYCFEDANPERLGKYCLTSLPNQAISPGDLQHSAFTEVVAGESFGRGSSREHAQLALIGAGIKSLIVKSAERIFFDNCVNYGLPVYLLHQPEVHQALLSGGRISETTYLNNLLPVSREVALHHGLLPYVKSILEGDFPKPENPKIAPRPMTMSEKIIAKYAGVDFVEPGQQLIVTIKNGYYYELQRTAMEAALEKSFPEGYTIFHPEKFIGFSDHLADLQDEKAENLRKGLRRFNHRFGIKTYDLDLENGIEGICHTVMTEKFSLPGDLILGNDSHTCTLGVNNALAVGKGASEMAAAMISDLLIMTVPETIRFDLINQLKDPVMAKDLMLFILSRDEFRKQLIGSNRIFEYGGTGLSNLNHDERRVLTNMAIEGQAYSAICQADEVTRRYLHQYHPLSTQKLRSLAVFSDEKAKYFTRFVVDMAKIEPMIALPGDTQNAIPLSSLGKVEINKAYVGSCTGGNLTDLITAAKVLEQKKVHPEVKLYVQASSRSILEQAKKLGLIDIFHQAGAELLLPACAACMGAGRGSTQDGDVMISATNRNFSGRTGKGGRTYLASPFIVAASAIKGYISLP